MPGMGGAMPPMGPGGMPAGMPGMDENGGDFMKMLNDFAKDMLNGDNEKSDDAMDKIMG